MLVERALEPLTGGLALAAILAAVVALTVAPVVLPAAVALVGTELVVSVHRGELDLRVVPLLAVGLLLVYEAGEIRHRIPRDAVIEPAPLRALASRLALTATLGLVASAAVLAVASISTRGGAAAAVVGGLAAAAAVLLVRILAADAASRTPELD